MLVISFVVHMCFQHSGLVMGTVTSNDAELDVKCLDHLISTLANLRIETMRSLCVELKG